MRAPFAVTRLATVALLFAASCSSGTYVTLTLQSSGAALSGISRIDLDLELAGKSASAKLTSSGAGITFPTTTVLDVATGEGSMMITANALDGSGHILAQTTGMATVTRGKTTSATLDFGGGVVGGPDMSGGPCSICDPVATCSVDNAGTATCACPSGYTGNGMTCTDVDECANGTAMCDANATCSNTPGSFTCTCNAGYSGNGFSCAQIWVHVADDPNFDLLNIGDVIGFGNRIYYGNENTGSVQYWHYVDLSMSTATASTIMPPAPPSQNDFCWCGNCGGNMKMLQLQNTPNRFYYWCFNLEYFDAMAGTWTQAATGLPSANQFGHAAVGSIGSKIYQVGGRSNTNQMVAATQILDFGPNPTSPSISTGPVYPMAIEGSASAVIGSKLYVFGGDILVGSQTQNTRKSYVLDTAGTNMWVALSDMPFDTGFYLQYTAVYKNLIWAFDRNNLLHSYDPATDKWDALPPIAPPPGYGTSGRGWMPVVSGTTPALYIINYANSGGMAKVSIFKYGLM